MDLTKAWLKIERFFGTLKFAVIILSVFSILMIIGTLLESTYGTDYANRMIYKTWLFMGVQFLMFLSITMALFLRLPPKKTFYGFYTIHIGLILMACGSFITWHSGIDGHVTLDPNTPTQKVELGEDQVQVRLPQKGKMAVLNLPYTPLETDLKEEYNEIKFKTFYPYSENKLEWIEEKSQYPLGVSFPSTQYLLFNDNTSQDFVLSLHPEAPNFRSSMTMGLLNLHYLPEKLAECFGRKNPSKLIFWDSIKRECYTPEEKNISINKTTEGKSFVILKDGETLYSFFPELSPWPYNDQKEPITQSPIRVFNKLLFEKKPHLFLFGRKAAFSVEGEWEVLTIKNEDTVDLPWMGFELQVLNHTTSKVPAEVPYYVSPIQKESKLIRGDQKAILTEIRGQNYWVTDKKPLNLLVDGENIKIHLVKKTLSLPFELTLNRFKMKTNPGTNEPASYESFVQLFTENGTQNHHIFMNNPLKFQGFTFYQSSYYKLGDGQIYGSVLSANIDPGRPFKYLGSVLLVFGGFWHYMIRRKKKSPNSQFKTSEALS